MKAYESTFVKKNGTERTMKFVKVQDLPESFLTEIVVGGRKPATLSDGLELVWDLDKSEFRVFNTKTTQGNVKEFTVTEEQLKTK